jgi:hypothetical protein
MSNEDRLHEWIATIPRDVPLEALTTAQQTVALIYTFELEVSNGGLEQFFTNPSGDHWPETLRALQLVGAEKIVAIVTRALRLFPKSTPSIDQLTRVKQVTLGGASVRRKLQKLTDEYYELPHAQPDEDAYRQMARYVRMLDSNG